jgi:hypothetical protein
MRCPFAFPSKAHGQTFIAFREPKPGRAEDEEDEL